MAKEIDKIKNNINYKNVLVYPIITFLLSIVLIILGLSFKDVELFPALLILFLIILNPLACLISALFGIGAYKIKKQKSILFSSIVVILLGLSTIIFTIVIANI